MPNVATGEKPHRNKDGSISFRITLEGRNRRPYNLPASTTDEQAENRRQLLAGLAARFRKAGKVADPDAIKLLDMAAFYADGLRHKEVASLRWEHFSADFMQVTVYRAKKKDPTKRLDVLRLSELHELRAWLDRKRSTLLGSRTSRFESSSTTKT